MSIFDFIPGHNLVHRNPNYLTLMLNALLIDRKVKQNTWAIVPGNWCRGRTVLFLLCVDNVFYWDITRTAGSITYYTCKNIWSCSYKKANPFLYFLLYNTTIILGWKIIKGLTYCLQLRDYISCLQGLAAKAEPRGGGGGKWRPPKRLRSDKSQTHHDSKKKTRKTITTTTRTTKQTQLSEWYLSVAVNKA